MNVFMYVSTKLIDFCNIFWRNNVDSVGERKKEKEDNPIVFEFLIH